jgi:hypothetical protein
MKILLENWKKYINENSETKKKSSKAEKEDLKQVIAELDQLSNNTFIYFDTETLGLTSKEDQITQLAYTIIKGGQKEGATEGNLIARLTDETRRRFKDGTSENLKWHEKNAKYSQSLIKKKQEKEEKYSLMLKKKEELEFQQIEQTKNKEQFSVQEIDTVKRELKDLKKEIETAKREFQHLEKDIKMATDPKYILQYTGYDESKATMTEKEMLTNFLSIINQNPNSVLVAHNIGFDFRFVNGRNQLYGLPLLQEGENIHTLLDTLKLCKNNYVPALEKLRITLEQQLKSISTKKVQQEAEQDIKNLSLQVQKASTEDSVEEKTKLLLTVLLDSTDRALQRGKPIIDEKIKEEEQKYSAKLGDIAKTINIDPAGAHMAIEDVRMLVQIFKEMKRVMVLVDNYIEHGEIVITEFINEIQEFQKQVKLKKSKSAPSAAEGGY